MGEHIGPPPGPGQGALDPTRSAAAELAHTLELLAVQTALREQADQRLASLLADIGDRDGALRAAEELAQLGSWTWRVGSELVTWSDQVHRIFGTDPDGPVPTYQAYVEMLDPQDREDVLAAVRAAAATGGTYQIEHRIIRRDGQIRQIMGRGRAELDADGVPVRLNGSLQDVTDARTADRELHRSRDLFAGVLDAATEQSIIATDADGLITVFNAGAERMLGYSAGAMIGESPERLHDADEINRRAVELGIEPGFGVFLVEAARGGSETRQWTYITSDGRRLQASITVSAMRGSSGRVTGYIGVGTDVTDRLVADVALRESEALFRSTFRYAPNGMMLIDLDSEPAGRLVHVNPALSRLTGYTEAQLMAMSVADLTADEHLNAHRLRVEGLRRGDLADLAVERHWVHADGRDLWVQFNVSPPSTGEDRYLVGQVEDITTRKRVEAKLTHQALHDGLTGLPNRLLLMDRIAHALAASTRTQRIVALLYVDLDGFKTINDTAGHAAGDRTLVEVARRLSAALRPGDTVARLGGDEFVVVCDGLEDPDGATGIAERLLSAVRAPYTHDGMTFALSASIGVSMSRGSTEPEQLLLDADQAMYGAKRAGKGRLRLAGDRYPDRIARSARAVRLEGELARAVDQDDLIFFGQPVLDLGTGQIVAVETLIRWQHPDRGLLGPREFLDVAEASELMLPIGIRAMSESCRLAASWVALLGASAPSVHVNISGRQLKSGNLSNEVNAALVRHGLDASKLVLELTETEMPLSADALRNDLVSLRRQGIRIAIDDLGTGHSSLARITELPVDILKIDLRFVAGMVKDPASAAVVRGILAIGSELGLSVVAEGVETGQQATQLQTYGCALAQGYLYGRPQPEEQLLKRLCSGS